MIVYAWKNADGLHLSRPPKYSQLTSLEFDPDALCRRCGQRLLSIPAEHSDLCVWCESNTCRPKLRHDQEQQIIQLLQKQSDFNAQLRPSRRRKIANRGTERDLRDFLSEHSFYGRSAEILKLELKAIERPGWVQVFEFHIYARHTASGWQELFGTVRTDERSKLFEVQIFDTESASERSASESTAEMIRLDRGPRHWSYWPLMVLAAVLISLAIIGGALSSFNQPPPSDGPLSDDARPADLQH